MSDALDAVVRLLDLEQIELDIFRGRSPAGERRQRVFGGQVAGQALVAAGRTVPEDRPVHSLHAYFIRPGDPAVPLIYLVDRVRDGRSFTTRRVSAVQHGKTIFTLSASFHHPEPGVLHARPMPQVPGPEELPPTSERLEELFGPAASEFFRNSPIDIRHVGPLTFEAVKDPSLRTTHSMAARAGQSPHSDLASSTSAGDSAKNRSGSSAHGSARPRTIPTATAGLSTTVTGTDLPITGTRATSASAASESSSTAAVPSRCIGSIPSHLLVAASLMGLTNGGLA